MSKVTDGIGDWFEEFVHESYPGLTYTGDDNNVPDFCHIRGIDSKSVDDFWLEAKVGNVQWGCRIKGYQIDSFDKPEKSIVYVLGMHNFDDANKRLVQLTRGGRRRYLERNAEVLQMNFITNPFMNLLYHNEKRLNAKETMRYCMIKPSVINNIFLDREFTRGAKKNEDGEIVTPGKIVTPESFYGFSYGDYRFFEGDQEDGLKVRAILDPNRDKKFIKFLLSRERLYEWEYT